MNQLDLFLGAVVLLFALGAAALYAASSR